MSKKEWVIIFDSSVGRDKKDIEKNNGLFVPFTIEVDGKEYSDGVDITFEQIIEMERNGSLARTSTASPGVISETYKEALKIADNAIVLTLSKHFSSMNSVFSSVAEEKEFKGKVHVIESTLIAPWSYVYSYEILKDFENNVPMKEVIDNILRVQKLAYGAFGTDDLKYLALGGRISKQQAAVGGLLGISPIMFFNDGKIIEEDTFKARNMAKGYKMMANRIEDIITKENINKDDIEFAKIHWPENYEGFEDLIDKFNTEIGDFGVEWTKNDGKMCGVMAAHLGPKLSGVGVIAKWRK